MRRALRALMLALLAAGITTQAFAQFGGTRRGSGSLERSSRDAQTPRDARSAQDADGPSYETVEYRLTLFAEALRPTAEQTPAWQDFQKKVRLYAADTARQRAARAQPVSLSAAQPGALKHLAQVVDDARDRLTALEDVEAAAKALLEVLTPDQRAVADLRIPTIVAPRPLPAGAGERPVAPVR